MTDFGSAGQVFGSSTEDRNKHPQDFGEEMKRSHFCRDLLHQLHREEFLPSTRSGSGNPSPCLSPDVLEEKSPFLLFLMSLKVLQGL